MALHKYRMLICGCLLLLSTAAPVSAMEENAQKTVTSLDPMTAQETALACSLDKKVISVSPIIHWARYGSVEDVKTALELNPDAGAYDEFGCSALHICLFNTCQECALAMIPLLASKVGIDYPTQKREVAQLDSARQKALAKDPHSGDSNVSENRPYNRTALFFAAKMGSKPLMQALLALKANINHQDSQGHTPLDMLAHDMQRIAQADPDILPERCHYWLTGQFLKQHGAHIDFF